MRAILARVAAYGAGYVALTAYNRTDKNTNFFEALQVMINNILPHPTSSMRISAAGLDAIAAREGFSATRYPDATGYSIGYGHFIKAGESFAEPMDRATALILLGKDAEIATDAVRAYVEVPLSQNEFDALTSVVYNIGVGAFKNSTLLRLLNAGDYSGAAAQFDRWIKSQGVTLNALIVRRESEKQQFLA